LHEARTEYVIHFESHRPSNDLRQLKAPECPVELRETHHMAQFGGEKCCHQSLKTTVREKYRETLMT
jgi:hypothetical protein